jgi:hypothetical protein
MIEDPGREYCPQAYQIDRRISQGCFQPRSRPRSSIEQKVVNRFAMLRKSRPEINRASPECRLHRRPIYIANVSHSLVKAEIAPREILPK